MKHLKYIILLFCCSLFAQHQTTLIASQQQFANEGGGTSIPVIESNTKTFQTDATLKSITINKPSGVEIGDLLIIIVCNNPLSHTVPWDGVTYKPSGFDLSKVDGSYGAFTAVFTKIADGTEGATSTITNTGADSDIQGFYVRISGVDTTTPIGVIGSTLNLDNQNPTNVPSITTVNDNSLIIAAASFNGSDTSPYTVTGTTGWVEVDAYDGARAGSVASGIFCYKDQVTAGTTGDCIISTTSTDEVSCWQFSINPE